MKLWNALLGVARVGGMLLLCPAVWAQGPGAMPPGPPPGLPPGPGVDFIRVEMGLREPVVKGAPYSAQTSVETVQVLADGNRIDRKTTGKIYRDNDGRTRREEAFQAFGPLTASGESREVIMISDPVAGMNYVLNPDRKTAREFTPFSGPRNPRGDQGGPRKGAWKSADQNGVTKESLGTQTMEGVSVQGTRITHTFPAGSPLGNSAPLQMVTETWYSPDLQTVVKEIRTDPMAGTTTFKLTNISRSEPDPSLFQVPADYRVQQRNGGPGGGPRQRRGMAPPEP